MELQRRVLKAEILHPGKQFQPTAIDVEIRVDPLTGHTARIVSGFAPLIPATDFDLRKLADETQPSCPFCEGPLETSTPRFVPAIWPKGRIERGEAVLFPNLLTYAQYAAVSVFSPRRHFLPLGEMSAALMSDNIGVQMEFERAAMRHDPAAVWTSINGNHMPPSGSSIFHPHLQGIVDPIPTTFQRQVVETPAERFTDYLETEKREGLRYLGRTGLVEWVAAFAPVGPGELRAFVPGVVSPTELRPDIVEELGHGIATALNFYAEMGFESYNMAMYGAPPGIVGYPMMLRLVCRSNPQPLYRSDVTYLERLHLEAAVDIVPESLVERAGDRFRR